MNDFSLQEIKIFQASCLPFKIWTNSNFAQDALIFLLANLMTSQQLNFKSVLFRYHEVPCLII
jgi:hypothetical protein